MDKLSSSLSHLINESITAPSQKQLFFNLMCFLCSEVTSVYDSLCDDSLPHISTESFQEKGNRIIVLTVDNYWKTSNITYEIMHTHLQ